MTDDSATMLWGIGALVLAISALTARRLSIGAVLRSLAGWLLIGLLAWALISQRDFLGTTFAGLGERVGLGAQEVEGETVRITLAPDGHFWARVRLNGHTQRMLVDSGATITALSPETAAAAGVNASGGFPVVLNTANGMVQAQRGRVETVAIGNLETRDLSVVVSPAFGGMNVLGMNFLTRLGSWRVEGRTLILEPRRPDAT